MTGLSLPDRPIRDSRKPKSPTGGQRGAGQHHGLDPIEEQVPEERRQVERHRGHGSAWPRGPVRSIHRTVGGPPAGGRRVALSPSDARLQPPHHPAHLPEELVAAVGRLRSGSSGRRSSPPAPAIAGRPPGRLQLAVEPIVPDRCRGQSRRPVASAHPGPSSGPSSRARTSSLAPARIASRPASGAAGAGRGWPG